MRWGMPAATPAEAAAGCAVATAWGGAATGSLGAAAAGLAAAFGGAARGAATFFATALPDAAFREAAFRGDALRARGAFPARFFFAPARAGFLRPAAFLRPAVFLRGAFFATLRRAVFLRGAFFRATGLRPLFRGRAAFFRFTFLAFLRAAIVAPSMPVCGGF